MSQSTLAALSPLSQSTISNISNGKYSNKICPEKCEDFGKWYREHRSNPTGTSLTQDFVAKDTRLTFHPQHELPMMRQWYKMCKSPSELKLEFYARELNQGHVRQQRPKVSTRRLKNWWKNERQKEKRLQKESSQSQSRHQAVKNFINLDNGSEVSVQEDVSSFFSIPAVQSAYR